MAKPKPRFQTLETASLEDRVAFYFDLLHKLSLVTSIREFGYDSQTRNFTVQLIGNSDDYTQFISYATPITPDPDPTDSTPVSDPAAPDSDSEPDLGDHLAFAFPISDHSVCLDLNRLICQAYTAVLDQRISQLSSSSK